MDLDLSKKEKVRKLPRRNPPGNLAKVMAVLDPVTREFANYFRMSTVRVLPRQLRGVRRRLRAKQLRLWKTPKRLHRRLLPV